MGGGGAVPVCLISATIGWSLMKFGIWNLHSFARICFWFLIVAYNCPLHESEIDAYRFHKKLLILEKTDTKTKCRSYEDLHVLF